MARVKYYTTVTVKVPPKLVYKNTALGGVSRQIQHLASPRAVFVLNTSPHAVFSTHTRGSALTNTYSTLDVLCSTLNIL